MSAFNNLNAIAVLFTCLVTACTATTESEQDLSLGKSTKLSTSLQTQRDYSINPGSGEFLQKAKFDNSGALPVDVHVVGNARSQVFLAKAMTEVETIFAQCQIPLSVSVVDIAQEKKDSVSLSQLYALTHKHATRQPTVFVIDSTKERDVAFSYLPSIRRDVSGTAWVTNRVSEQCFAWITAHEIGHIILDDSLHHADRRNVMNRQCSANNNFNTSKTLPRWTETQCIALRQSL